VLEQANTLLRGRLPSDRFVTAFLGWVGPRSLRYANAGHLTPLVLRTDGSIAETVADGLPLGVEEQAAYATNELALIQGDVLFAFTDGILEARRDGKLLGGDGLRRLLLETSELTREPQELAAGVHERVRAWATGLSDDAAIVALRRHGGLALADSA
jgi:serine phosphatase RsbU (regulator of sigma subunit)